MTHAENPSEKGVLLNPDVSLNRDPFTRAIKPFDMEELIKTVREVLVKSRG